MIEGKIDMVETKAAIIEQDEKLEQESNTLQQNEFNWDFYEHMKKPGLNVNKSIKTKPGEVVYSHEDYAQDAYYLYSKNISDMNFKIPKVGEIIEATIVFVGINTAYLDINYREYAYLELKKEEKRYLQDIKEGNLINVKILNGSENNKAIIASYTDSIKAMKETEIKESINMSCAFTSTVKELISGGFIVDIDGIQCFMPGSQVTMNKIDNFDDYVGEQIIVMPVNFSPEKGTIVVSARAYLQTLIPDAIEYVKSNPKQKYKGKVTGATKFGVFCEFGIDENSPKCLTGLIHISDLDKKYLEQHKQNNINPGNDIEFFVKEVAQKNKIILTQTPENNPWNDIDKKYKVQSTVPGKVLTIKEYGAFIELEKGISGLLHYSEYEGIKLTEGDIIKVKITRIEKSSKKITFTVVK